MIVSTMKLAEELSKVKEGDKVVVVNKRKKRDCCDLIEGTVKKVSKETLLISFNVLPDKLVKKSTIISITRM